MPSFNKVLFLSLHAERFDGVLEESHYLKDTDALDYRDTPEEIEFASGRPRGLLPGTQAKLCRINFEFDGRQKGFFQNGRFSTSQLNISLQETNTDCGIAMNQ